MTSSQESISPLNHMDKNEMFRITAVAFCYRYIVLDIQGSNMNEQERRERAAWLRDTYYRRLQHSTQSIPTRVCLPYHCAILLANPPVFQAQVLALLKQHAGPWSIRFLHRQGIIPNTYCEEYKMDESLFTLMY